MTRTTFRTVVGFIGFDKRGIVRGLHFETAKRVGRRTIAVQAARVLPSRMFAGPNQYPPRWFRAYGILAFNTLATPGDKSRYNMICEAYLSALPYYMEIKAPPDQQMVTVWPIDGDGEATKLNEAALHKPCADAVSHYGFVTSLRAIEASKRAKAVLNGRGPFLLAWAPGDREGQPDAPVLVSNLSNVVDMEDAKAVLVGWVNDIEDNPSLWSSGWNVARLGIEVRLWVDRYGEGILQFFGKG